MKKTFIVVLLLLFCSCTPKSQRRFEKIHEEDHGFGFSYRIILDKETGVKYLCTITNFGGGITVLKESL